MVAVQFCTPHREKSVLSEVRASRPYIPLTWGHMVEGCLGTFHTSRVRNVSYELTQTSQGEGPSVHLCNQWLSGLTQANNSKYSESKEYHSNIYIIYKIYN